MTDVKEALSRLREMAENQYQFVFDRNDVTVILAHLEADESLLRDTLAAFPDDDGVQYRLIHSDVLERIRAHLGGNK